MLRFTTKAEWAEAQAQELEAQAQKQDAEYVHYTKLGRKREATAHLRSEASRFRSMAANYRRKGL